MAAHNREAARSGKRNRPQPPGDATPLSAREAAAVGAVGRVPWTFAQTLLGAAVTLLPWLLLQLTASRTVAPRPPSRAADALGGITALIFSAIIEGAFVLVPTYYAVAHRAPGISSRDGLRALGLRRTPWRAAAVAVAGGLVVIVAVNALYAWLITLFHWNLRVNSDVLVQQAHTMPLTTLGYLVAAVLIAPVCEEIFFRGFLFGGLPQGIGLWPAALLSAALLGLAHGDLGSLPVLLVIGLVLALVRWRFGSLLPSIVLHAGNNALAAGFIIAALVR